MGHRGRVEIVKVVGVNVERYVTRSRVKRDCKQEIKYHLHPFFSCNYTS